MTWFRIFRKIVVIILIITVMMIATAFICWFPPNGHSLCRYEGSLSGIEPWFPVTRYSHCRRITYNRKLIRQTLERCGVGTETVRSAKSYSESPQRGLTSRKRTGFDLIKALFHTGVCRSYWLACISSRITTVIQVRKGKIQWTITDLMSHSRFRLA